MKNTGDKNLSEIADGNSQTDTVIPNKRYFTISEVADLCGVKPHVLRYWEQVFPMLSPVKRRGNRRYYQHRDIVLIRNIYSLLYERGFTISGARQQIMHGTHSGKVQRTKSEGGQAKYLVREVIHDLEAVLTILNS